MLTTTMTFDEMVRELRDDREWLMRKLSHRQTAWRRRLLKHKGFTLCETDVWTCPRSKNVWVWSARVRDARHTADIGLCMGVLGWVEEGMQWYLFQAREENQAGRDTLIVFRPHAWQRYRERAGLHRLYGRELVMQMVRENTYFGISADRTANSRTAQRMREPVQIVTRRGAFLGERVAPCHYVINTFITHSQTAGRQREVLGRLREQVMELNARE